MWINFKIVKQALRLRHCEERKRRGNLKMINNITIATALK